MSFSNEMALLVFRINRFFSKPETEKTMLERQKREDKMPGMSTPRNVTLTEIDFTHVKSELICSKDNPTDRIVMYIHGGGFNSGNAKSRRDIAFYIVTKMHYNVLNVNYRLAPIHKFPCAQQDVFEQYNRLYEHYGSKIVVMGESAGGNLTLSLPFMAKEKGTEMPLGLVAISPVVQYEQILESYRTNRKSDPIVDPQNGMLTQTFIADGKEFANPIAAPYCGDFTVYPPTQLIVSDSETLFDDSILFYEKLKANGIYSELIVKHNMMHAFAMTTLFPESKEALLQTKKFIDGLFEQQISRT